MIDIPWHAIAISVVVSTGLSWLIYKDDYKKSNLWKVALFLRFICILLVTLLLFSPIISFQKSTLLRPKLLIYRDASLSCDSQSQFVFNKLMTELNQRVSSKVDIKQYKFANEVIPESAVPDVNFGSYTRFDEVGNHVQQFGKDESVVGAIVLSDGIVNKGKLPSFFQSSSSLPLHVIGIGDTTKYPDLNVQSLIGNEMVYQQNKFVIEASIFAIQSKNNSVSISIKENGRPILTETWKPGLERDFLKRLFEISPSQLGWVRYTLSLTGLQNERNINNNEKNIWVQVVDQKKKIHLVYGRPHPDLKAMKLALESKVQNEIVIYSGANGIKSGGDLYIFHGFPSNKKELEVVRNLNQQKIPHWIFVDNQVALSLLDLTLNQPLNLSFAQFQEVTTAISDQFGAFGLDSDMKTWKQFGPVLTPLMKLSLPQNFQVELVQKWNGTLTNFPLMGLVENDQTRSIWFFGNGIWRWRMNEQRFNANSVVFDDWLSKNILWLAAAGQKQKELKISIQDRELNVGEAYPLMISHFDKTGSLTMNGKVKLFVIDSANNKRELSLMKSMNAYKTQFIVPSTGQYKLRAELEDNHEVFDEVIVNGSKSNLETSDLVSNFEGLRAFSRKFNGKFYNQNQIGELIKQMDSYSLNSDRLILQDVNLSVMQIFWVLLIICVLFSIEWFLRKWLGKI